MDRGEKKGRELLIATLMTAWCGTFRLEDLGSSKQLRGRGKWTPRKLNERSGLRCKFVLT